MITKINDPSPLEKLLRQSLEAIARTEVAKVEASANLAAALSRIACNFRLSGSVDVHTIVEASSTELRLNGYAVRAPRLLVQCAWRDASFTSPLTLVYTPIKTDAIALQITYGSVGHRAAEHIVWSAPYGWHIPGHGNDIGGETHERFLRAVLHHAGLFGAQALSLEPITVREFN